MVREKLEELIGGKVQLAEDLGNGDYTSNVALVTKTDPQEIVQRITTNRPEWLEKVEVAGPGFINFFLAPKVVQENLNKILQEKENYGRSQNLSGQKIIIEYTDPNPFKEFHIGHLMSNTIGEALSRLVESSGAEVKRANYQGDVGLHVAKAVWGAGQVQPNTAQDWGRTYATGAKAYEADEEAKKEIHEINKKIYTRSDEAVNKLYDAGRLLSLEYFETIYAKLGTKFDFYFFESEMAGRGLELVKANLGKVFEASDGAIVFHGEKFGLHTRVFINSEGLPTYEAKELALAQVKHERYPYDQAIVVTGNEIVNYFKVLLKALSLVSPGLAEKTKHIAHGMLRLPSGKMSSRSGDVITAEQVLGELGGMVSVKNVELDVTTREQIAVGAIKYQILKQAPGKDIIFDLAKAVSFEGDSGPYLQYTLVRTHSVLEKAQKIPNSLHLEAGLPSDDLARFLIRFPEVVARAAQELAPQLLLTYLLQLSGLFNAFYAQEKIIGSEQENYSLALTAAVGHVLRGGLTLLGLPTPARM